MLYPGHGSCFSGVPLDHHSRFHQGLLHSSPLLRIVLVKVIVIFEHTAFSVVKRGNKSIIVLEPVAVGNAFEFRVDLR